MTKSGSERVTEVISQQSVRVNGIPHVKDLRPFQGSHPSNDEGNTEDSGWPIYLGLCYPNDPSNISGLLRNTDMINECSTEEQEIQTNPLQKSTRNKKIKNAPALSFKWSDQVECGGLDELEPESSNGNSRDLPYRRHKRDCLCLVCRTRIFIHIDHVWSACFANYKRKAYWRSTEGALVLEG